MGESKLRVGDNREQMKVLIINASPRSNGLVSKMMSEAETICSSSGHDFERVELQNARIAYCTGCCRCRTTNECILPHDDAHDIARKIETADLLVIGTPTYWGNMAAPLKALFDRTVYIFADLPPKSFPKPKLSGKRAIVIATCSTPYPFNIIMRQSRGAIRAVNEVLHTAGFRTRSIEIGGTVGMNNIPNKYVSRLKKLMNYRLNG